MCRPCFDDVPTMCRPCPDPLKGRNIPGATPALRPPTMKIPLQLVARNTSLVTALDKRCPFRTLKPTLRAKIKPPPFPHRQIDLPRMVSFLAGLCGKRSRSSVAQILSVKTPAGRKEFGGRLIKMLFIPSCFQFCEMMQLNPVNDLTVCL